MSNKGTGNLRNDLNRMNPVASNVKLGDLLEQIASNQNALITNQNAILAKLDAIGGAGASSAAIATAAGTTNVSGKTSTVDVTLPSKL